MKKILMIVGSLRKESFNLQLAKLAEEMLKGQSTGQHSSLCRPALYESGHGIPRAGERCEGAARGFGGGRYLDLQPGV